MNNKGIMIALMSITVIYYTHEDILVCNDTEEGSPAILSVTWKPKQIVNARLLINLNSQLFALCESHPMKCLKVVDTITVDIVKIDNEEYNITAYVKNAMSSGTWTIEYVYGFSKPAPEPCRFEIYSKKFIELKDCPTEIDEGETVSCSCKLKSSKSTNVLYSWFSKSDSSTDLISNNSDVIIIAHKHLQDLELLCVAEDLHTEINYTKVYNFKIKYPAQLILKLCVMYGTALMIISTDLLM
ncbi:hypothetical protein Bpfe_003633 [Biomphalaria pfeifferi]|uniref:Uncharacterized protein n=1 Tax=Biomphalaria pfeifferi TaxID=112525 RepID=A0AAD8C649_BIOPF|nr:hypothetical protein Bpfe_003633 [Biomphalaria pfeifferi]